VSNLLEFFVIKVFEIGPLISFFIGIASPRWIFGTLASVAISTISTIFLTTFDPMELAGPAYQLAFGNVACLVVFAVGKGLRLLFNRRSA
jgi:hypothetical protein